MVKLFLSISYQIRITSLIWFVAISGSVATLATENPTITATMMKLLLLFGLLIVAFCVVLFIKTRLNRRRNGKSGSHWSHN